nr:methyltransferase domain-containing protein [Salipaludibacillus sp. CUR1]
MAEKTKNRIHWIARNAAGQTILDAGCSQGLLTILLGREGKRATGVDISAESIAYAAKALEAETASTRENVEFIEADFLTMDFKSNLYDTVAITEVLEHFVSSEAILQKAYSLLKDNGRLIITVPFGINDFPDHKRTLYLREIADEISPYVAIDQVEFFGKWIGFTGTRKSTVSSVPDTLSSDLIKKSEEAFYTIERELLDRIDRLKSQAESIKEKNQKAEEEFIRVSEQLAEEKEKTAELHSRIKELEKALEAECHKNDNDDILGLLKDLYNLQQNDSAPDQLVTVIKELIRKQEDLAEKHNEQFVQQDSHHGDLVIELIDQREAFTKFMAESSENEKKLLTQLEELSRTNKDTQAMLRNVTEEKNELFSRLDDLRESNKETEKELEQVTSAKDILSSELNQVLAANSELRDKEERVMEENSTLRQTVDELEEEHSSLQDINYAQSQMIEEAREENIRVKEEFAGQLEDYENLLTEFKEEMASAQGETRYPAQTAEESEEAVRLAKERDALIQKNLDLKNDYHSVSNRQAKEIQKLKEELYTELGEKETLLKELKETINKSQIIQTRYENLKKSRMNRLTIAYWGWRKKLLKKGD